MTWEEQKELLRRGIQPERDLWPEIDRRIQTEPPRKAQFPWLAAAAVLALAVFGVALSFLGRGSTTAPAIGSAPAAPGAQTVLVGHDRTTDWELAIEESSAALLATLNERRGDLDPDAQATIEENLRVLEHAIADIRQALAAHPESHELNLQLAAHYHRELELLRRLQRTETQRRSSS